MDTIADHVTTAAEVRAYSAIPRHPIRPELLGVLREGGFREAGGRERSTYRETFDRLVGVFGQSAEMATVSWCIASNLARLIRERDPIGWRWGANTYGDPFLERAVHEFEEFENLFFSCARKFFPIVTQMRDCLPFEDEGLADLVKALQPFARPRTRAADRRSEWHATAKLFAERIEAHFRAGRFTPPTRNSARSPLVLAVQSLLDMLGLRVEAETIRKVLSQSSADQMSQDLTDSA
jgi:hypothetical protein